MLALAPDEFARRSVALPGSDWEARCRELVEHADVEVIDGPDDEGVFARANVRMIELARGIDEQPNAIVVWNGQQGDGPGGTRDFVTRLGCRGPDPRIRVIDPTRRAYEARQAPGAPKKLLALDGRGIRGALSLAILTALESRLRDHHGRGDYVPPASRSEGRLPSSA